YDEYVWSLEKGILSNRKNETSIVNAEPAAPSPTKNNTREQKKSLEQTIRTLDKNILQFEKKIATLQLKLNELNQQITSHSQGPELNALVNEFVETQQKFSDAESEWLNASEEIEAVKAKLIALTS